MTTASSWSTSRRVLLGGGVTMAVAGGAWLLRRGLENAEPTDVVPLRPLDTDERATLEGICDRIIPETEDVGARHTRTAAYVEKMLIQSCPLEESRVALDGLRAFVAKVARTHGRDFAALPLTIRDQIVADTDMRSFAPNPVADGLDGPAYRTIKRLTLQGFYTSEAAQDGAASAAYIGSYVPCAALQRPASTATAGHEAHHGTTGHSKPVVL